jgi:two-component system response regulator PilR (NtrC family)
MVLVVDDVPGVIIAFGAALRRLSVPFVGAGSLTEARQALTLHHWSAFIIDIELPDGCGIDLLEFLRADPEYRRAPAAIITARIDLDDSVVNRIQCSGAAFYCGAFTTPQVNEICLSLLRQPT